jgi:hypothetical protein
MQSEFGIPPAQVTHTDDNLLSQKRTDTDSLRIGFYARFLWPV